MKATYLLIAGLWWLSAAVRAQEPLITSSEYQQAIAKQTRQTNGMPGADYWQNSSDYVIQATVDVENKVLTGSETITYHNNSPDTLKVLVVRLYQDLFKKGVNRNTLFDVDPRDVHDGVVISGLSIDGREYDISDPDSRISRNHTLMRIPLSGGLWPGRSVKLSIDWQFHIPEYTLIRMGTIDSTSLFMGQWYPQMAVYDDLRGWDTRSYNGMAEFYNDFSNYTVEITVPPGFMVWATGEALNQEEVLQAPVVTRYQQASVSDSIIQVITPADIEQRQVTTNDHTWKFRAVNVSDFAFALSDHYVWDVSSVEVDSLSHRRTVVGVAYPPQAVLFDRVAAIARETVRSLSFEQPGIPFPFPSITAFNGSFGMEYPMMTNVGAEDDYGMTIYAHSHEITHSYFPFLVGTNETLNGWIDEGFTVFLPEQMQLRLEPSFDIARMNTRSFAYYAGRRMEPAVMTPTCYLDPQIYFYLNYAKTDQALRLLQMQLGPELFHECLIRFMDRWQYKHPDAYDLFNTFNEVSGQDLNWFWNAWYFQTGGIPDLTIRAVENNDGVWNVRVTNDGSLPLPVQVNFFNGDLLLHAITIPASRWVNYGDEPLLVEWKTDEPVTRITLGSDLIPDARPEGNEWK